MFITGYTSSTIILLLRYLFSCSQNSSRIPSYITVSLFFYQNLLPRKKTCPNTTSHWANFKIKACPLPHKHTLTHTHTHIKKALPHYFTLCTLINTHINHFFSAIISVSAFRGMLDMILVLCTKKWISAENTQADPVLMNLKAS